MDKTSVIRGGVVKEAHLFNQVCAYLKNRFPTIQFHLSLRRYKGGKSLKVYWQGGPTKPALKEFVETFQGCSIENMTIQREKTYISLQDQTVYASWGIDFIILKRNTLK